MPGLVSVSIKPQAFYFRDLNRTAKQRKLLNSRNFHTYSTSDRNFDSLCIGNTQLRETRTSETERCCNEITPCQVLRGRDGRDGLPGLAGRDGKDGEQGERGETGDPGVQGEQGWRGEKGDDGVQGLPGPQGAAARSGVVYTRWGRTTCPSGQETELVYSGRAGGSYFSQKGGGSNYLCMPDNPQYSTYVRGVNDFSILHGVEYWYGDATPPQYQHIHRHNAPCAVCHIQQRGSLLMIPARKDCPTSWTKEYEGTLMSPHKTHYRGMFECVDREAESVPGSAAITNGAFFINVEASCTGMACPPYDSQKELLCVVCTK